MELKPVMHLTDENLLRQLYDLVVLGDKEFIPPLSYRASTTQQGLSDEATDHGVDAYFEELKHQCFILAMEGEQMAGFMSFKQNYVSERLPAGPNLYASTSVVHPDFRGQGLMTGFYKAMIEAFPTRPIYTRTWHTNFPHLKVLSKLGFRQLCCLENDRGPGIHTVYFGREPH